MPGQVPVQLDGYYTRCPLQQFFGERAATRANFDDQVFAFRTGGRRNAFENRTFD